MSIVDQDYFGGYPCPKFEWMFMSFYIHCIVIVMQFTSCNMRGERGGGDIGYKKWDKFRLAHYSLFVLAFHWILSAKEHSIAITDGKTKV